VEVGGADTGCTLAHSYSPSSDPPALEQEAVAVAAEHSLDRPLQACCTVDSSPLHQDMQARSVAAEAAHDNHRRLRDSGAGVDTGRHSVANSGHVGMDAGVVGAGDAEEAKLTDTEYGMGAVEEGAPDVWDALIVGEPSIGGEVDAEVDE
jgi:hypothetical protein